MVSGSMPYFSSIAMVFVALLWRVMVMVRVLACVAAAAGAVPETVTLWFSWAVSTRR